MKTAYPWRILIVEDNDDICSQIEADAVSGKLLPEVGSMETEACSTFNEAVKYLEITRFDFLILDLKDDPNAKTEDDDSAGLGIFEEIKKRKFVPVIFYSAIAHKVERLETAFVRIVEKTEGLLKLREEFKKIYNTGLPDLIRYIEEQQREYMWDFVNNHWDKLSGTREEQYITYLLARRLSNILQRQSIRNFLKGTGRLSGEDESEKIHPLEMYVYPSVNTQFLSGDILQGKVNGSESFWVVLTPNCDFEHNKVERALLARCSLLTIQPEYIKCKSYIEKQQAVANTAIKDIKSLLGDNRKKQPERFKFLASTFFIPDLVVDFQDVAHITISELEKLERITSLDSPFAEALLARFARYYGRLGTPDLDTDIVFDKLGLVPSDE